MFSTSTAGPPAVACGISLPPPPGGCGLTPVVGVVSGCGQWVWFLPPQDGRPVAGGGGTLLLVARGKDSGVPGGASQNGAGQAGQGESTRDSSRLSRDSILTVPLTDGPPKTLARNL